MVDERSIWRQKNQRSNWKLQKFYSIFNSVSHTADFLGSLKTNRAEIPEERSTSFFYKPFIVLVIYVQIFICCLYDDSYDKLEEAKSAYVRTRSCRFLHELTEHEVDARKQK